MKITGSKYMKFPVYPITVTLLFLTAACKREKIFLDIKKETELRVSDQRFNGDNIVLSSDTVYRMVATGASTEFTIRNNQTLIIQPGTLIKVEKGVRMIVSEGGRIVANGTAQLPIIFTSAAFPGSQGGDGSNNPSWQGIKINGKPGFQSGIMKYVRIEFAGLGVSGEQSPGLLLQNADSSMGLDFIQVSYTFSAPAFVFSGGKCNAKHLFAFASGGSDFDFRDGYHGKLQFILAQRNAQIPFVNTGVNLAGIICSGQNTLPQISNASVIGPDLQPGTTSYYTDTGSTANIQRKAGIVVFNSGGLQLRNTAVLGFPVGGLYLDSRESALQLQAGQSEVAHSIFHANDTNRIFFLPPVLFPGIGSAELKAFLLQLPFANSTLSSSAGFQLTKPFDFHAPNFLPQQGSLLLNGANFSSTFFNNAFFEKVNYKGAFGNANWLSGWTNYNPLQTRYNN